MSNKVDTSKWVSKLIYNGTEISLPDTDAAFEEGKQEGIDLTTDKLCPQFAESSSVVSCDPLAGYPLSVVSKIEVAQSGTGNPSPTNIRPISGYSTAKLTHGGKNLLDVPENLAFTGYKGVEVNIPAGTYVLTWARETHGGANPPHIQFYGNGTGMLLRSDWSGRTITLAKDETMVYIYANNYDVNGSNGVSATIDQLMLSVAGGDYEPYRAQTYEIDLGQTVYGGTLDWSTGVLTVDSSLVTFTGQEDFKYWSESVYTRSIANDAKPGTARQIIGHSTHIPQDASTEGALHISMAKHAEDYGGIQFFGLTTYWGLAEATVDAMKAYLAEQYAAGTPVQITYKLATPITIQLTPQEIIALSGANILYSDTGKTEVSGKADPEASFRYGQKAEYDRFWDEYQNKGGPKNYRCAFNGYGWTEKNFYPKYDIKGGGNTGYQTFMFFNCDVANRINLSQRLKDCGVKFDTSDSKYMQQTFYYANVTVVPELSTIGCTGTLMQTFMNPYVETIEKLILRDDGVQTFNQTFNNATALKNITIEGKIGQNGFDIHWSPLTKASIESIINALSTTTSGLSITLSKTAVETAFGSTTATEWTNLIGTKSNWTINLV